MWRIDEGANQCYGTWSDLKLKPCLMNVNCFPINDIWQKCNLLLIPFQKQRNIYIRLKRNIFNHATCFNACHSFSMSAIRYGPETQLGRLLPSYICDPGQDLVLYSTLASSKPHCLSNRNGTNYSALSCFRNKEITKGIACKVALRQNYFLNLKAKSKFWNPRIRKQ